MFFISKGAGGKPIKEARLLADKVAKFTLIGRETENGPLRERGGRAAR